MKSLAIFLVLMAVAAARPEEFYNPRYDSFNAQELAQNVRLLKSYGKCFLDKGPCTAEGSDFKKMIPDALRTSCAKCSPKQQELVRTVIKAFQTKLPDLWKELILKHDPNGEYRQTFNNFIKVSN